MPKSQKKKITKRKFFAQAQFSNVSQVLWYKNYISFDGELSGKGSHILCT